MKILRAISIFLVFVFLPVTEVSADTVNYSDTTRPIIESITLNPSVVNVSTEGAVLIATIVASDDLNSMNSFNGYLDPFYGANPQAYSEKAISTKVLNGRVQTTFQLKYVFKKGTPVGNYQIRATVYDAADNRLIGAGANMPGNSFQVVNDVASGPIDVTQFDYSAKLQEYALQTQRMTAEVANNNKKILGLEKQIAELSSSLVETKAANELARIRESAQNQTLTSNLKKLEIKLKGICSKKPKPKGC